MLADHRAYSRILHRCFLPESSSDHSHHHHLLTLTPRMEDVGDDGEESRGIVTLL